LLGRCHPPENAWGGEFIPAAKKGEESLLKKVEGISHKKKEGGIREPDEGGERL